MIRTYESIEEAVKGCFGEDVTVTGNTYVSGGDINSAACLVLSNGQKVFVKSNSVKNRDFFDAEENGLEAIGSTGTIGTPKLLCKGADTSKNTSFLMMEMIETGRGSKDTAEIFGYELAAMHNADTKDLVTGGVFGFDRDNFIGASKQVNTPKNSWIEFFRQCRLEPQFKMAQRYFDKDIVKDAISFLDRLDDILTEPGFPSLLHGDLWSGNYIINKDGQAMLIDPAAYVGHAEADIAMTELFGRFPGDFYRAYHEKIPMEDGYTDRREVYNLYHLTNHLNLFGGSYLHSVTATIRRFSRRFI